MTLAPWWSRTLGLLCIDAIQLFTDVSRSEMQKTRLSFRFRGAVAALLIGALGEVSSLYIIGLLVLVGGLPSGTKTTFLTRQAAQLIR